MRDGDVCARPNAITDRCSVVASVRARLDDMGLVRDVQLDVSPDWHPDDTSEASRARLATHLRPTGVEVRCREPTPS